MKVREKDLKDRQFVCPKCEGYGDVHTEQAKEKLRSVAQGYGTAQLDLEMKVCTKCEGSGWLDVSDMSSEDFRNLS